MNDMHILWYYFSLICLVVMTTTTVHGGEKEFLNLAALRSAGYNHTITSSSISKKQSTTTHVLYNRFNDPLPADNIIAPLCGNGVLDNFLMDYPGNSNNSKIKEQWNAGIIFVGEICDDGNRLDGDGCAADCASMDALTSPCPLAIDTGGEEIITMGFFEEFIFAVFTPTRMIRMESVDLTVRSIDKFSIGPVVIAWQEQLDFFVYGGGRVWMPFNSQTPIPGLDLSSSSSVAYDPLPVLDSKVGIILVDKTRRLSFSIKATYLVTSAGEIVDIWGHRVTNWTNSSKYAANLWHAEIIVDKNINNIEDNVYHDDDEINNNSTSLSLLSINCIFKDESQVSFKLNIGSHTVLPNTIIEIPPPSYAINLDPTSPGYPWIYLISKAFRKHMVPITTDISDSGFYGSFMNNITHGIQIGINPIFMASPFSIIYPKFSPRDMLTGMQQIAILGGDPSSLLSYDELLLSDSSSSSNAFLCNGINAS